LTDIFITHGNSRKAFVNTYGNLFGIEDSKFEFGNLQLLKSEEFDNNLVGFIATAKFMNNNYYSPLGNEIRNTLKIIDQQLK
jgi:hypothetical protein